MFTYLLLILVFLVVINILFNYNRRARLLRKVPGPKFMFLVGNAMDLIIPPDQLFQLFREYAKTWGTIWRMWSFPFAAVFLFHPADIEVLLSGVKHNKKSLNYNFLKPWLRDGLLVSDGKKWQNRRKILTPAFHFNILRRFCTIFEDNSQRFTEALEQSEGKPVNVVEAISEYTLHTICETAMGTQLDEEKAGKSYKEAIYKLGELVVHRSIRVYLYVDFMYYLSILGRLEKKYLNIVHSFTTKVIDLRRQFINTHGNNIKDIIEDDDDNMIYKKRKTAMLDLMISAEKNGMIDQRGIQEEVDTFMFEGHDTTACGLTFFLVELANNKDIQDRIVEELKDIFGDSKRRATIDDLSKMQYLERCIKESLRLYPPVPLIGRVLSEEVTLGGYVVPAGTHAIVHVYDLHRCEELYENPSKFDPDRFLPENCATRHPYAYIPFSAGPRNCIGQKFAMLEMKSVTSGILRRFVLEPQTRVQDLKFSVDIVLRTSEPVYISFSKRADSF